MPYSLPSINDLPFCTSDQKRPAVALPYTVTIEQAYKILNHTGAIREAETELYKALHHFNGLTLAEQDALEETAFHDYWIVYLSRGIVTIEPMYEEYKGLILLQQAYKCLDRSDVVILQTNTPL